MRPLLALLAAALATTACSPVATKVAPRAEDRFPGRWSLDEDHRWILDNDRGSEVRLTYSGEGAWAYRFSCVEGSNVVRLHLPPKVGSNTVIIRSPEYRRQTGGRSWTLRSSPDGASRVVTLPAENSPLYAFVGDGRLVVDDADLSDDRAALRRDRWRFSALCEAAPKSSPIAGEPAARSVYALMRSLHVSRAETDARLALSRGDRRPAVICDYSCVAPAYEWPSGDRGPRRIVDPTHDHVVSAEQGLLKEYVREYAIAYNRVIATASVPRVEQ